MSWCSMGRRPNCDRAAVVALGGDLSWGSPVSGGNPRCGPGGISRGRAADSGSLRRLAVQRPGRIPICPTTGTRSCLSSRPCRRPADAAGPDGGGAGGSAGYAATATPPRTLDLDLIAHGRNLRADADLMPPHPRAAERYFVMGPLAEIAPHWRHPPARPQRRGLGRKGPSRAGREAEGRRIRAALVD